MGVNDMKKVRKIFLCIGLIIFAVSLVAFVIDAIMSAINSYSIALEDDIYGTAGEWFWICLNIVLIPIPFLLSEISLIKNGYILLTNVQLKKRKIFCTISSILALSVIVMILLVKNGCFEYRASNTILLTLWPIVIASFVLGSIQKEKNLNFKS